MKLIIVMLKEVLKGYFVKYYCKKNQPRIHNLLSEFVVEKLLLKIITVFTFQ